MQVAIDITSEALVKTALGRYKTQQESPDLLLSNVIADLHSNADSATVVRQAVTNSIAEGIRRMERQAMASEAEFESVGQLSLLGELVPEHKIPAGMKDKTVAEVVAWMESRAEIEAANLEELRAAVERQEQKTKRLAAWAKAPRQIYNALVRAGIDPHTVSYADAINKAETFSRRRGAGLGETTAQSVR
jgi:ribulose kinase